MNAIDPYPAPRLTSFFWFCFFFVGRSTGFSATATMDARVTNREQIYRQCVCTDNTDNRQQRQKTFQLASAFSRVTTRVRVARKAEYRESILLTRVPITQRFTTTVRTRSPTQLIQNP